MMSSSGLTDVELFPTDCGSLWVNVDNPYTTESGRKKGETRGKFQQVARYRRGSVIPA